MKDETNLGPLPAEVDSLLEHERARPGPPPEVSGRMYGRLAVALGLPQGPGAGGPDGPGGADPGAPPADPGLAPGGMGATSLATSGAVAGLSKTTVVAVAVAFTAGAVAGSVTTYLLRVHDGGKDRPSDRIEAHGPAVVLPATPEKRIVRAREPAVRPAAQTEQLAPARPVAPRLPLARRTSGGARISASRPAAGREEVPDRQLAAERALVERARSALVRSRPADALAAVEQHRRAFPDGRLTEEREAICVLALVAVRQYERARKIALRFRKRYPKSLLISTVEAALKARPRQARDRERPGDLQ